MAVCFEDMVPEVRTHLSGAPEDTCIHYLRRATQQFCQDTQKWTVSLGTDEIDTSSAESFEIAVPGAPAMPATDTTAAIPAGPFQLPDETEIISIERATFDGRDIDDLAYDEFTERLTFLRRNTPRRRGTGLLEVFAVLQPSPDAEEVPNAIGLYRKTIADHAIFEMGMMPNQHWSMTPRAARVFLQRFRWRCAEATVKKAQRGANRPFRCRPPAFT